MIKMLLRHILPLAVLGTLTLSSCVIHEHDRGHGHGGYGRGHGYDRGRGYGYDRGRGY